MPATWIVLAAALSQADAPMPGTDVAAAPVASADTSVIPYPAAFFADARPTNAFDMIQRLPGFAFDGGENVRGFAGAAGNVLIDGDRPTSKAVSLEDLLKRIPATSVVRIDLIRGGAPGIDMQGQALVANVIRSTTASQNLAVSTGLRWYGDDWLAPQAGLEWSRRAGDLSLEGAANYAWNQSPDGGEGRRIRYFPGGAVRESGPFFTRERALEFTANGSAELDRVENVYRLNVGVSREDSRDYETVERFAPTGAFRGRQLTRERRIDDQLEIGGDYTRLFSDTLSGQLIGLQRFGREKSDEVSTQPGSVETANGREKSGESILRAVLTAQPSSALTLEGGAEGAFNYLDAQTRITEDGVPVVLPNANVRVEEKRAEAFATASWKPMERLSIEAGARFEASRISQTGDTNLSRSFFFPKPRLLVAYAPDASSQLRLRIEREVGQLNFGDFVANADFGGGTVSAGGVQLEPERAWVFEAAVERRFWGRGALVLTLTHEEVQAVVDRIPFGGFDAPGNIGDGTRDRLEATFTLPLDRLYIRNGLITGRVTWRRSSVTDPVTGRERRISGEAPFDGEMEFSQDIASLNSTWGVDARFANTSTQYRINEIRRESEDTFWGAYWDWKPSPTLSIRAEARNILSRERRRWRERFSGPRNLGLVSEAEWQDNTFEPYAYVRVRKAL